MSDTSGDKIVHRALAPLPELSSVVFFRKSYHDFITGRGPMPIRSGKKVRTFLRGGTWVFLGCGVLAMLAAGVMELSRGQSDIGDVEAVFIIAGPLLLVVTLVYWLLSWSMSRRAVKEQRLSQGGLIGAELTGIKYFSGGGDTSSPSLRVDYRFTAPDGQVIDKRQSLPVFDFHRKNLPPVGSKVLLLYVDAETFEVL